MFSMHSLNTALDREDRLHKTIMDREAKVHLLRLLFKMFYHTVNKGKMPHLMSVRAIDILNK